MAQVKCKFNAKSQSDVKLIYLVTSPVGNTDVQRVISNTELSTAERGPSSVTVQQFMSSALRPAVLSTAERLRHRPLLSS